jgi:hypothetical protein
MTATLIAPPAASPQPGVAAPRRRRRRWHRIAVPLGMAAALIVGSIVVHELAAPDRTEPSFLSPTVDGPHSGRRLAELLRARGIAVHRETSSAAALRRLWASPTNATLFVPAPEFVHTDYLWMMGNGRTGSRIVLVEPSDSALGEALPMIFVGDRRWSTAVTSAGQGCEIVDAGPAAVTRNRYGVAADYDGSVDSCYEDGLLRVPTERVEFVVAGSADPFRDDLIGQHDNAGLAVDLLAARPSVVWLDLHTPEEPAPVTDAPGGGEPTDPTFGRGGDRDGRGTPVPGGGNTGGGGSTGDEGPSGAAMPDPPSPYPNWLFPLVVALLVAIVLLGLARGRRLGRPVAEPLPVTVHGAETAIGRGRLYRRAKARGPALDVLRAGIRRRLTADLGLPSTAGRDDLVAAVVARTGDDRAVVLDVLYGPEPEDDEDLHRRAVELINLADRVNPEATKENR